MTKSTTDIDAISLSGHPKLGGSRLPRPRPRYRRLRLLKSDHEKDENGRDC